MQADLSVQDILEGELFEVLGLSQMDEAKKGAMLAQITEIIQMRAYYSVYEQLSDSEKDELDNKIPSEEMLDYLMQKGFDMVSILVDEAVKYRLELIAAYKIATAPLPEPANSL